MYIITTDSPQGKTPEEAKQKADEREEKEKEKKIISEKDQFEETVGEHEKGKENEEEKTEEVDGTAHNEQEKEKRQMEATSEAGESIKRKKEKDKRTTTKRRKVTHEKFNTCNKVHNHRIPKVMLPRAHSNQMESIPLSVVSYRSVMKL